SGFNSAIWFPCRRRLTSSVKETLTQRHRSRLVHESVFNQGPKSRESVAPGDFLPFRKIAPVIRDRHLVEFVFALEYFGGNLRLEIEAVRFDLNVFDHVGAEDFITGLHV